MGEQGLEIGLGRPIETVDAALDWRVLRLRRREEALGEGG